MKEAYWIDKYTDYLRLIKTRAENTIRACVSDITLFSRFISCDHWEDVSQDTAAAYVKHLQERGLTDNSIFRKAIVLNNFFKYLKRQHLLAANPFEDIEVRNFYRPLPNPLTVDEINKLLGCIREPLQGLMGLPLSDIYLTARDRAMLEVAYSAGLRVSELVGLNWNDVHWSARELRVFGKYSKERIVPLGQYALDALLVFAKHYQEKLRKKAEGPLPIFISNWNRRINQRSIPRTIAKWAKQAGIKRRVNPHSLRHSCAQHMLDNGCDIAVVQTLLGHAHVTTTQIYTTVTTRKLKSIHSVTHPRA